MTLTPARRRPKRAHRAIRLLHEAARHQQLARTPPTCSMRSPSSVRRAEPRRKRTPCWHRPHPPADYYRVRGKPWSSTPGPTGTPPWRIPRS